LVDFHAHVFPPGLGNRNEHVGDGRWPWLDTDGAPADPGPFGTVMVGDAPFRRVRRSLWDVDVRAAELAAAGVVHQVVSPMPALMTDWARPQEAASFSRDVNDGVADYVTAAGGGLSALGTVPMQDTDLAILELERCMGDLGFAGVQIGAQAGGRDLDDPGLFPFLDRAAQLDAVVAVHPLDGGADVIRRTGPPYDFGLGMLTDTAIAATALVVGGVLERLPRLRVLLAHGCGSFPWVYPRLRYGATLRQPDGAGDRFDELVRRLWVDTLVFDATHIDLLVRHFGENRVVVGTDYPFINGQLDTVRAYLAQAPEPLLTAVSSLNAAALLQRVPRHSLLGT
jgi:aminocarboxymuconate-semialdehyde decarboxylase